MSAAVAANVRAPESEPVACLRCGANAWQAFRGTDASGRPVLRLVCRHNGFHVTRAFVLEKEGA